MTVQLRWVNTITAHVGCYLPQVGLQRQLRESYCPVLAVCSLQGQLHEWHTPLEVKLNSCKQS